MKDNTSDRPVEGENRIQKQVSHYASSFPNEFLPLHHPEVRRATGFSDKTLKKCLNANPEQLPYCAVSSIADAGGNKFRINPRQLVLHREELTLCQKRPGYQPPTFGEQSFGCDSAMKGVSTGVHSATSKGILSTSETRRKKSMKQSSAGGMSGGAKLKQIREEWRSSRSKI